MVHVDKKNRIQILSIHRDKVNGKTKYISSYSKRKRLKKLFVNQNNRRRGRETKDKEGGSRRIQEIE